MSKETKTKKDKGLRIALARLLKLQKDIATDDGQILTVEGDIEVGAEVYTVDENGDAIPAADGTYTAGSTTYTVAGGVITAIEEAQEEEDPATPEEEEQEEETPEEQEEQPDVAALQARITELEAENAELRAELEQYKEKEEQALGKPLPEKDKEEQQLQKTKLQAMLEMVKD